MASLIPLYKKRLNLPAAQFTFIDHEDAMVAAVFRISQSGRSELILKVCSRKGDFLRESYFLNRFAGKILVPKIIQLIEPEEGLDAAVLMECIQGDLLKSEAIIDSLASEIGALLARIHLEHAEGYGDLTDPSHLSSDPRIPFTMKFEEGLEECKGHLPESLLETCRRHFDRDIDLLLSADGPCVIHRDFRPDNIIASDGKVRGIIDWSSGRGGFTVKRGTWESRNSKLYQFNLRYLESLARGEKA